MQKIKIILATYASKMMVFLLNIYMKSQARKKLKTNYELRKYKIFIERKATRHAKDSCWILQTENITDLKNNEILIETEFLSIDPYMRGRMNAGLSYAAPVNLGDVMVGESVGRVVESKSKNYSVGDLVTVHQGWQTYIKTKDSDPTIIKVPESNLPSSVLGTLGMPGRTAYFGLNHVGKPNAGETLVVSAASGAVGSVVGQLGKLMGCRVIGIAGGQEKSQYVAMSLGLISALTTRMKMLLTSFKNTAQMALIFILKMSEEILHEA